MADQQTEKSRNYKFKAEVSQLLNILTHSLYTHRDIFIRELVSNSADALDKIRLKDVMGKKYDNPELNFEIRITLDKESRTFTISDTGIGMSKEELINNIGTIARSGTSEFIKQLTEDHQKNINLIGRFGVGFYSVFMAAEKVEVITKSAEKNQPAYLWISDGQSSFKILPAGKDIKRGTSIKVQLREEAKEFAEVGNVKEAVEKYSNFVPFPIYIDGEQVNKISAIWREPKSSVKKKQYIDFFKFISRENDDPMTWLHLSSDVPIQFHALLFVPKTNFELLGFGRKDEGINLFVRRVMVDSHAKDILPPYLRFISGVIESDDLPLNISRETLQENPFLFKIKNTVVTKFLTHLQNLASKKEDEYKSFWKQYGRILKEGYSDYTHKDKLAELFRFDSSKCIHGEEFVSLKTYSERMIDKQESIYFLSGTSREALDNNPNVEIFRSKEIEVLYCYEPVDEFVLPGLFEYNSKKIISADQEDLSRLSDILSKDQKTEKKESQKSTKEMDNLARRIKDILGDKVENVKISERLVDSPAVLVSSNPSVSSQMEKIMHMVNQDAKTTPKVMEINTKHPLIRNLLKIYKTSAKSSILTKAVNSLFNSVLLLDGSINDTHGMAAAIQDLISETTKLYINKNKNAT